MSKRSKEMKPALADWQVTTYIGDSKVGDSSVPLVTEQTFSQSWWAHKGDRYIFHDEKGVLAELAAGPVVQVRRKDPVQTPAEKVLAAEAARTVLASKRQNGDR